MRTCPGSRHEAAQRMAYQPAGLAHSRGFGFGADARKIAKKDPWRYIGPQLKGKMESLF